jgi:Phage capsid family
LISSLVGAGHPDQIEDLRMKSRTELGELDRSSRAGEWASLVRHFARGRGSRANAAELARAARAPARVVETLEKSTVTVGGLTEWGTQATAFRLLADAFVDSLRHGSIFYRMLADGGLIRLPFAVRVGSIINAAGASIVTPGAAIPVSRLDLEASNLERKKAAALLVLSRELLDSGTAAESLISRSLRASVSLAVDSEFVTDIKTGGAVTNAATANVLADLATALTAVGLTEASRPYWLAAPDVAIRLATVDTASANTPVFPSVSPVGGSLLGIPLLVSSAVPAGTLTLVDTSGIGGASDGVDIMASEHGTVEMEDAPASTAGAGSPEAPVPPTGPIVSLWQENMIGVRVLAYWGAAKLRRGGVATITGISW